MPHMVNSLIIDQSQSLSFSEMPRSSADSFIINSGEEKFDSLAVHKVASGIWFWYGVEHNGSYQAGILRDMSFAFLDDGEESVARALFHVYYPDLLDFVYDVCTDIHAEPVVNSENDIRWQLFMDIEGTRYDLPHTADYWNCFKFWEKPFTTNIRLGLFYWLSEQKELDAQWVQKCGLVLAKDAK